MSIVHVTNWDEFVQAVGVSGDTVVLPAKAVWDLNETHPNGVNGGIRIRCAEIHGSDTEITNIRFLGGYRAFEISSSTVFENLHLTNMIADTPIFDNNQVSSYNYSFDGCRMSALLGTHALTFNYGLPNMTRCSISVTLETSEDGGYDGCINFNYATYCRFTVNAPSKRRNPFPSAQKASFCEVTLLMPAMTYFYPNLFSGCVLHGGCQSVHGSQGNPTAADFTTVYDSGMFSNDFSTPCTTFIGVTDAQMQDADYLWSIGFAIAR